jgi:hypothetical protein
LGARPVDRAASHNISLEKPETRFGLVQPGGQHIRQITMVKRFWFARSHVYPTHGISYNYYLA